MRKIFTFSQVLYTSNNLTKIVMNHDEHEFEKKLQKFSVVKKCPQCKQLSLSFNGSLIICSNCGYEEQMPVMR